MKSASSAMSPLVQISSALVIVTLILSLPSTSISEGLQEFSVVEPSKRAATGILKNFIGDDGRVYACSGKNFYAFESNGSIAWRVYLKYTCNVNIAPVHGGSSKIYLVADNRVLILSPYKVGTSEPAVEEFFCPAQDKEVSGEIVGISASVSSSCVLITVKNQGLFAYRLHGKLLWNAGPVLYHHGYRQGCRKNITECYFASAPVIDHCDASIFILNTVGELYSISVRGPYFKWIQDLSSFGNTLTITPGNNGLLYVTIPESTLVLALNVSNGNILWRGSFGPLSSADYEPAVNANGWISFGSLDGYLYSFSPTGDLKRYPRSPSLNSVIQVNPIIDCSGYALYISETEMEGKNSQTIEEYNYISALKPKSVVFTLLAPASGSIYWSKSEPSQFLFKLSQSDLQNFILDERNLLTFFAASRIGNPLTCHSTYQRLASSCSQANPETIDIYTGNERTIIKFLIIESVVLLLLTIAVRFCCIFWKKKKLQDQSLGTFLKKRQSLVSKEKAFDQMITELEEKATKEPSTTKVQKTLSDLVRGREDIRRKLSTTYSLGRDAVKSHPESLLPLYEGKQRRYSFQGFRRESMSIFLSETASSEEYHSCLKTNDHSYISEEEDKDKFIGGKGKAPWIPNIPLGSDGSVNSLKGYVQEIEEVKKKDGDEEEEEDDDDGMRGDRDGEGRRLRRRTMCMSINT